MAKIQFQGKEYERHSNTSVLDTLLEEGLAIPHGCKSGICQSCLMRATEGEVPAEAQSALKETQQAKNYFLSCSCYPENDITVVLPEDDEILHFNAAIKEKENLNGSVIRLRLTVPEGFSYKAGQFINLIKDEENQRSYSLASVPEEDDYLELQIKVLNNGLVSGWIKNELQIEQEVQLSEAHGDCYYQADESNQPILLIGTGTGLAPLIAVVRDALKNNHKGQISLYHGASQSNELYLQDELNSLADKYGNFSYSPCVSKGDAKDGETSGRANEVALQQHPDLKGYKIYLCGNPNMTEATRKKAFLAGANFSDILVDAFKFATT